MDESQTEVLGDPIKEIISQTKQIMTSRFGLLEETVVLPTQLKRYPKAEEMPDDIGFRNRVRELLPKILLPDRRILIIENIATQHAVATTPSYLEQGIDSYFTFIPEDQDIRPKFMRGSYYHPERVISVALANKNSIDEGKSKLVEERLRALRLVFDAHATFEFQHGLFNKFIPSEDRLRELDIRKIVVMGEFPPEAAKGLMDRRINRKEDWDEDPLYDYLRTLKTKGYDINLIGLDTRQ